jgi:hypothetical protein
MAEKEAQLERFAGDLRETFRRESERAQQLRESYMATVRALSNAVEARDLHGQARRACGGLRTGDRARHRFDPGVVSAFLELYDGELREIEESVY